MVAGELKSRPELIGRNMFAKKIPNSFIHDGALTINSEIRHTAQYLI
jgi:hypothetical protein